MSRAPNDHRPYRCFAEFWPAYLAQHAHPVNRALHFAGTASLLPLLGLGLCCWSYAPLLYPLSAYGCAWLGHFLIERNRPATFSHPWWSLRGDYRMFWLMLTRRLPASAYPRRAGSMG